MTSETLTYFSNYQNMNNLQGSFMIGSNKTGLVFDMAFVSYRNDGGINDFKPNLIVGTFPPLINIYRKDMLEYLTEKSIKDIYSFSLHYHDYPDYPKIYLFISNLNENYEIILPYLNSETTVFMSSDTYKMYREILCNNDLSHIQANLVPVEYDEIVDLGDFKFQLLEVPNGIPGNAGFVAFIGGLKVLYPGDLTRNGVCPDLIARFEERFNSERVDFLINRGVHYGIANERDSYVDPIQFFDRELSRAKGLVYLNIHERKVNYLAEFIKIIRKQGRKLVMEPDLAKFWSSVTKSSIKSLQKHSALSDTETVLVLNNKMTPLDDEIPFETVTMGEILNNKSGYVYYSDFNDLSFLWETETFGGYFGKSLFLSFSGYLNRVNFPIDSIFKFRYKYCELEYVNYKKMIIDFVSKINPKIYVYVGPNSLKLPENIKNYRYTDCFGNTKYLRTL